MPSDRVGESELLRLLDALYGAVFEPTCWEVVLERAMKVHRAGGGRINFMRFAPGENTTLALRGIEPAFHEEWMRNHSDEDVWAQAGLMELQTQPELRSVTGAQLVPVEQLRRTMAYGEVLEPFGIEDALMGAVSWSANSLGGFALWRGPAEPLFEREDCELHDWICRHARRALALGMIVRSAHDRSRTFLERMPCAGFVCQADGTIVLQNERGEALLRRGDGLTAPRNRLRAAHPPSQERLVRALEDATRSALGESLAGGTTLPVPRGTDRLPLALFVDPVPSDGQGAPAFPAAFAQPVAFVLASDPEARTPLPEEALASAFGLTPTEARMLSALCAGESPADYAERHRISRETARFHVKQLLAKTGARRQAELVRMGLESVARLAAPAPE